MSKSKSKLPAIGTKEYRAFLMPDLKTEPEGNVIDGHAAVIGQSTNIGGYFNEIIERGAFDKTDFTDVLFSINHDLSKIPLARSRNNNANSTLQLQVDDIGLAVRAQLDIEHNNEAEALYSSIQRQDIQGMSFIFCVRGEEWEGLETDMPTRHITDIAKIIEVSAVSLPAYDQTDINARDSETLDSAKNALDNVRAKYINAQNNERRKKLLLKTYL